MEILNKLIEDTNVLYIYELSPVVYGINLPNKVYDVIVGDNYKPIENESEDIKINMFHVSELFDAVTNTNIRAWQYACLPKKYVIKEYVKLLVHTNPLQLRKDFDFTHKINFQKAATHIKQGNTLTGQKLLWEIVKFAKFANQIIENHKIVNFKEAAEDYRLIVDGQITDYDDIISVFNERLTEPINLLHKYTDDVLRRDKIEKIIQK